MVGFDSLRQGPLTRRCAPTSPPRERWCMGKLVPQLHLSLGGEVARRAGEGAFAQPKGPTS
jgi:hypothetical protein